MEMLAIVALALLNLAGIVAGVFERRAQRAHLERLERIVAARDLGEAAAAEDLYARAVKRGAEEAPPERTPDQFDEFWGTKPRNTR